MALEVVRLRCSGTFWPWRGFGSCRFPGQGTEASGSVPMTGRESKVTVKVPVAAGFADWLASALPCGFGSGCWAELGSMTAWSFKAPAAAGSAVPVSQTSNYVFKPTAVPPLGCNQSLPRGGGLTRRSASQDTRRTSR
jgi:hypothetical protein